MKLENEVIKSFAGRVLPFVAAFTFLQYDPPKCFSQPSKESTYHYIVGRLYELNGDFLEGLSNYEQALRLDPDSAYLHNAIGNVLMKNEDRLYAEVHLKHAISMNNDLIEAHINLSNLYLLGGDYEPALKEAEEVIRIDPDNMMGHGFAGEAAFHMGVLGKARKHLEGAARVDIDKIGHTPIYKRLGDISLKERDYSRAIEEFKTSMYFVEKWSFRSRFIGYESMLGLAESYYHLKNSKKSKEILNKLSRSLEKEENKSVIDIIKVMLKDKNLELLLSHEESQKED